MKRLLFIFFIFSVFLFPSFSVKAATNITNYQSMYYYCNQNDVCNSTDYRSGSSNVLLLYGHYGGSAYTFEFPNGFNNYIPVSLVSGRNYTFIVNLQMTAYEASNFSSNNFYNRFSNLNYVLSSSNINVINASALSYSVTNCETGSETYCTYNLSVSYTISAKSNTSSINLGMTTGSTAYTFGFYEHYYNSSFKVASISYELNSEDTIVNQNQQQIEQNKTIINQNQQIINNSSVTNQKIGEVNNSINETNDTIKDSNVDEAEDSASSFFSGFNTDTFGLTSIITAPLTLIGSITSSSCTPLGLEIPFINSAENSHLYLPCMSDIYSRYFNEFFDIYQIITFGVIAYWVCVNIFRMVKDFKNPDHDEIEVIDL